MLCVVGPAASGKSRLLRVIAGIEPPDRGEVTRLDRIAIPEPANRKVRPQDLSHRRGANQAQIATEVLSALGLWDVRQKPIAELSAPQLAACDLVETLIAPADLIVLDEHLDRLDPWVRAEALRLIRSRCAKGAVCVAATNQLELASQFDFLIVLKSSRFVYSGSIVDLVRSRGPRQVQIESEHNAGARALVDPLLVEVLKTDGGFRLTPGPGQEHTARMLREGYGDVKFVVSDEKSLPEIILSAF